MDSQIYKITNLVNGKAYIGQHNGSKKYYFGSGTALKRAILKHGRKAFIKEIICEGNFGSELLDFLEQEAIDKHQTYAGKFINKGYNMTSGGAGNPNGVTKFKRKDSFIGRKKVYQYSLNGDYIRSYLSISEAAKECNISYQAITNSMKKLGYKASTFQWRIKYSSRICKYKDNSKANAINGRMKAVNQYDLNNNYIRTFSSAKEASSITGITVSGIRACCYGNYKYYKNYKWSFVKTSLDNPNNQY